MVWTCLLFIGSGQNHLARNSEMGRKTRQTGKKVGRQHQGMDRPGVRQVPEGSGEQSKMEETACEVICGAPTTPAVKGQMQAKVKVGMQLRMLLVLQELLKFRFLTSVQLNRFYPIFFHNKVAQVMNSKTDIYLRLNQLCFAPIWERYTYDSVRLLSLLMSQYITNYCNP